MASTYPTNVAQVIQWPHDNPLKQDGAAIQAASDQPWDAGTKSLAASLQLMVLMGKNSQWTQNLGNAFPTQPQDVMDSIQRLRQLAQRIDSLEPSTKQEVTTITREVVPINQPANVSAMQLNTVSTSSPVVAEPAPAVIAIEPANPDVVYAPNYNPNVVYGSWTNTAYPLVYLPPLARGPFADSFVRGSGYSMGIATACAPFSSIDQDGDDHDYHHHGGRDHRHHDDDDYHRYDSGHRDGSDQQHSGDSINISANDFNRVTGRHLTDGSIVWRHNPNYRDDIPYHNQDMIEWFHQTNARGGTGATSLPAPIRDSQRQTVASQFQQ